MNELKLKLEINLTVDSNLKVTIGNCKAIPILDESQNVIEVESRINNTSLKYGFISFSPKSKLADCLNNGDRIHVKLGDKLISSNIGKRGRISGLTSLFKNMPFELEPGDKVTLSYLPSNKILEIKPKAIYDISLKTNI